MAKKQVSLFDEFLPKSSIDEEWEGMPEFISDDMNPCQQIIVSFKTYEDVREFGRRLGIHVTPKTNSSWFPPKAWDTGTVYVNENWAKDEE